MKIVTRYDPPPIPNREFDWRAIDQDTYDGAEDSPTRYQIGYGRTEEEAIADLHSLLNEAAEVAEIERVEAIRQYLTLTRPR